MPKFARIVAPGYPHHITQRGNRRQPVFFSNDDRKAYLDLMATYARAAGIEFWAYCLMSNHVHLLAVPTEPDSLAKGIGDAHRRYTRRINFRNGWRGFLFQGRFCSCVLDEAHARAAVRHIEQNPVRAGLVAKAEDWPWSSAGAHLRGVPDPLLAASSPLTDPIENWADFLAEEPDPAEIDALRRHQRTGRPLGDKPFVDQIAHLLGRPLAKAKPGPKRGSIRRSSKRRVLRDS